MTITVLNVTASVGAGYAGWTDGHDPNFLGPLGSVTPASADGHVVGSILWENNLGPATFRLELIYSGTPPADNYVQNLNFTSDTTGFVYNLGSPGLTTSLFTAGGNLYKVWTWNSAALPSTANPFTFGHVYAITLTTGAAPGTPPLPSNLVGVGATVSGNTVTTVTGFPFNADFSQGAFSLLGYSSVTVSAVQGQPGSDAMAIGLNSTPSFASSPIAAPSVVPPYVLYFHSDVGQYNIFVNGVLVTTVGPPVTGDVGSITYNGTTVVFAINAVPVFTYQVPQTLNYLPLYPVLENFYSTSVITLGIVPGVFSTATGIPYANLITSEHNQKPKFMQLVSTLTAGMGDVTAAIQSLVPAFDLNTAVGAQLDIIGLWVGQSRVIPGILVSGYFGFSEVISGLPDGLQLPFGELTNPGVGGQFFELGATSANTTTLTDPQYLTILKARIARNQSNGTLGALEGALFFIFGSGCKVVDNGTKSLAITVSSPISPVDQSLISGLDILPRPAGVAIGSITFTP